MRQSVCSDITTKEYLVREYCEAAGLRNQPVTNAILDAAVRQMHKLLLCDLNPPWVDYHFPQALPGQGVLSRFTRPSFLQWKDNPQGMARKLFGNEISDCVQHTMEYMRLEHAGFVARPLYACTNCIEGEEMCMNVASMSKFIEQRDARGHYRCKRCIAPVTDSVPLRVLDLYMLVSDGNKTAIMRSKPYRLRLRTPPPQWAWGVDLGELPQLTMAMPNVVSHAKGMFYDYNDRDSEAIWCYSCSYEGKACE